LAREPDPASWTRRLGLLLGIIGVLALVMALGARHRDLSRTTVTREQLGNVWAEFRERVPRTSRTS
jgi:hypothetical protein